MYNNASKPLLKTVRFTLTGLALTPLLVSLSGCGVAGDAGSGVNEGIVEFPIAYVKRVVPLDDDGSQIQPDTTDPLLSMPGGDLYIKDRSSIGADEENITRSVTNGLGDVKDINVSYDGKTIVFSLKPEDLDPNDNIEPKWDIYTYNIDSKLLKRVIASDISADGGDDLSPAFLPDDSIVFSSNRQKLSRSVLLDEGLKPSFSSVVEQSNSQVKALVLHVMDANGENIKQISFNQSHDLDASVLSDGRIMFSRWDSINNSNDFNLYTILPDGTDMQSYYGTHAASHPEVSNNNRLQILQPRELSDGRVLYMAQPFDDSFGGGDIYIADATNFVDLNQTTDANIGAFPNSTAVEKATTTNVVMNGNLSLEGRYSSVYPLNDNSNRMLVSKGLCQVGIDNDPDPDVFDIESFLCIERSSLSDPLAPEAYPAYGIWIYDRSGNTEKPVVVSEPGLIISDAVAMQPTSRPPILTLATLDAILESENVGILNIRSIYDFDGAFNACLIDPACTTPIATDALTLGDPALVTADQREARFLRIVKAVGIPDRQDPDLTNPPDLSNLAFGPTRNLGMKEIIGYSEIQPDGSVRVKVPANVAFYFDVLDKDARRIGPRHDNWLQVQAGETLECSGCHIHSNTATPLPHGRKDAEALSSNAGAPNGGYIYPNTLVPGASGEYVAVSARETMAEVIARTQASQNLFTAITPSVDVKFTDSWTDDVNMTTEAVPRILTKAADINYVYTTDINNAAIVGLSTPVPTTPACELAWSPACRIVINYKQHIQPIWELDRLDAITSADVKCITCHTYGDAADPVVPIAQLNLEKGVPASINSSDEENDQYESYRELMFSDEEQEVVNKALRNIEVPDLDANGDQIIIDGVPQVITFNVARSITTAGARFSYFMEKMTETELNAGRSLVTTVDHANMLTPAELRLIAEWIDIGGQYFNNPFDTDAPQR